MTPNNQFGVQITDLWDDIQQPDVIWQLAVLAVCLGIAWLVAHLISRRDQETDEDNARLRITKRSVNRLAFPATALGLVLLSSMVLKHWQSVKVLSIAVQLLGALAIIRIVFFVLRYSFRGSWLGSFERFFGYLTWGIVALHISGLLPELVEFLESISFTAGRQRLNALLILEGIFTVFLTLLVALWASGAAEAKLMSAQGIDNSLRTVFARLTRAGLIVLAVLIGLPIVGIDLTTLSVFGGALGVGLGFGLQKIAANYISGFIILLDRSIRIGDLIAVGGDRGEVTRITTRYTVLKGGSGIEAIVPNEVLVSSVVQNESFSDTSVRLALPVQVAYGTDLELAMAKMVEAAVGQPRVLKSPPAKAFVIAFADSGINLELGFWVGDPQYGTQQLRSDINLAIWRNFQAANIEIPYPRQEVRLLGEPAKAGAAA